MSRIISYPYDDSIKAKDAWVGTDEASRQTKQYTAEALAEYLNISGSISIIGQMTYKYGTTPLNGIGTLALFGGGPDIVAFSAVVKLTLSNQDISNQRVVEFLDLLVGSDILIAEQGAISTFGYYSIDSYAINATDSNYYDLGVTFKSGNGSMRSDRIYEAQNFVLANDATQSPWNTVPDGISYTAANVGIGTVTPSEKLEVSGGIIGDTLFVRNTDGYNAELLSNNLTTNRTFNFPDVGGTLALTTDITSSPWDTVTGGINYANGNVGIGTVSPSDELTIEAENPTIRLKDISSSNYAELYVNNFDTYLNSNGRVFLQSGGSTRATVTPAGNVGIGTTSPSDKLHVSAGAIRLDDFYQLRWGGTGTGIYGHSSQGLDFYTNSGTTRLKIENSGNVGIGTTSPSEKLEVTGPIGSTKLTGYKLIFTRNANNEIFTEGASSTLTLGTNSVERMRISSNGNVGIGTTSPSEKLEVAGQYGNTTLSGHAIGFTRAGGNYLWAKTSGGDLRFTVNGNPIGSASMIISSSGNVGIGATSPSEKLEIYGGNLIVNDGTSKSRLRPNDLYLQSSGTINAWIRANGVSYFNGGNVGIGTTAPSTPLHINADAPTIRLQDATSGDNHYLTGNNGELRVQSSGYITMRPGAAVSTTFLANGNVGIGTTSPDYPLHVDATIKIGDRQGTDGSLILQSQQGPNITFKSTGDVLDISGTTGATNGNSIRLSDNIKKLYFNGGIGGTIAINRGNRGLMDSNVGGLEVQQQDTAGSNGKSTFLSTSSLGTILRSTSYGTIGTSGDIQFQFGGGGNTSEPSPTTKMIIKNSGNVGIGEANPSRTLSVKASSSSMVADFRSVSGNNSFVSFSNNASTADQVRLGSTSGNLVLSTNYTERMRIASSGNVGIGTTSPNQLLEVANSTGDATINISTDQSAGSQASKKYINLDFSGYNNNVMAKIQSWDESFSGGNGYLTFSTRNASSGLLSQAMVLDYDGNVGIGTTSPSEKLEVDGQVLSDGYRLAAMQTAPATRNSAGTLGEIVIDGNHIYVCYATDSWSRVALDTSW